MDRLIPFGRIVFALALLGLGVEHFVFRRFVTANAPAWPESMHGEWLWAYLTGTVLIATAGTLLVGKKERFAALLVAAMVLFWGLLRQIPPSSRFCRSPSSGPMPARACGSSAACWRSPPPRHPPETATAPCYRDG